MTLPLQKVKAQGDVIFFDAAGTLIHLARPVGRHYAEVARRHGVTADEEAISAAFREVWRSLPAREPSPLAREGDDAPWWKDIALRVLRKAAHLPGSFDENAWFEEVYERFAQPGIWQLYDDVLPCLERLCSEYRLAVLSNFDGRLRRILADLGIARHFEHLFISSEMGCEKPHPEIFRRALETMNISPPQALHVGDDPHFDQNGGEAAGVATFLVRRPEVTLDQLRP